MVLKLSLMSGEPLHVKGKAVSVGDLRQRISEELNVSVRQVVLYNAMDDSHDALSDDVMLESLEEVYVILNCKYIDEDTSKAVRRIFAFKGTGSDSNGKPPSRGYQICYEDGTKRDIYAGKGKYTVNCDKVEQYLQDWRFRKHCIMDTDYDSSDEERTFEYTPESETDEWETVRDGMGMMRKRVFVEKRVRHRGDTLSDDRGTLFFRDWVRKHSHKVEFEKVVEDSGPGYGRRVQRPLKGFSKLMAYWLRWGEVPGKTLDGFMKVADLQLLLRKEWCEDAIRKTARESCNKFGRRRFELSNDEQWVRAARKD